MRIEIREKKIGIVIFMDLVLAFVMGWQGSLQKFPTLTTFQSVLIGIVCVFLFFALYFIKVIGSILRLFCSLIWTMVVIDIIPLEKWTNNSKPWMIGVKIVLFLIFLGIHMRFHEDWKEDFTDGSSARYPASGRRKVKKLQKELRAHLKGAAENFQEAVLGFKAAKRATSATGKSIDDIECLMSYMQETLPGVEEALKSDVLDLENLQEIKEYLENLDEFIDKLLQNTVYLFEQYEETTAGTSKEQEEEADILEEMFFAGCNDEESIKVRYRQLMQSFHPDQKNGDEEMTKRIQSAYEARMKKV